MDYTVLRKFLLKNFELRVCMPFHNFRDILRVGVDFHGTVLEAQRHFLFCEFLIFLVS